MKIRKSLLAAATAATVSVTGVVAAPAFAQEAASSTSADKEANSLSLPSLSSSDEGAEAKGGASFEQLGQSVKEQSSDKDGNWDPKQIVAWIGVFTAVLGAVNTLVNFVEKNFNVNR